MKIVHFPDPRLRVVTKPITVFDDNLQKIIDDMIETMYDAKGVGLAATQVGLDIRVAVMDVSREENDPIVMINPEILESRDVIEMEEGCLSVPAHYDTVKRATWVKMRALDRHGEFYELESTSQVMAECIQHELDHLNGKLYIDQLSILKRQRIKAKIEKLKRQERI